MLVVVRGVGGECWCWLLAVADQDGGGYLESELLPILMSKCEAVLVWVGR